MMTSLVESICARPTVRLREQATFSGRGLHTGLLSRLTVHPAPPGWWLFDNAMSLHPVQSARTVSTSYQTAVTLPDGKLFRGLEHILAAMSGLCVEGCSLQLEGEEVPAVDGSAEAFCRALLFSGSRHHRMVRVLSATSEVVVSNDTGGSLRVLPSQTRQISCRIAFPGLPPGVRRSAVWEEANETFEASIAPTRTFTFLDWIKPMRQRGLAMGGRLTNAVVFTPTGTLGNQRLFSREEPPRHKILDLVGDLALLGAPLLARVEANLPGHTLNANMRNVLSSGG